MDGDQTLGRGRLFWSGCLAILMAFVAYGSLGDPFSVGNATYIFVWMFMAMGLSVLWGYAGVLSFGQTAFFGIGGYSYGIISANLDSPLFALMAAVLCAAAAAAALGYFLFYGGVSGVFVGIVTLALSLALEAFLSQTGGPEWSIGNAVLGGFNGMTDALPLSVPWFGGSVELGERSQFFFVLALLVVAFVALRILLNMRFGDALAAIRNNPVRAATLGINVPLHLVLAFSVAGLLAGLSGALYTAWGQYITPDTMGLNAAVLPIIWLAVSGRSDLSAAMVGTFVIVIVSQQLSVYGSQYALIVQGVFLVASIFLFPKGILLGLVGAFSRLAGKRRGAMPVEMAEARGK